MIISNANCKELYKNDKDLYDRIYDRLKDFKFDAKKTFPADFIFRKYSTKGEGPIVRSIRVPSVMNAGVDVQKGLAANGGMVRVDMFSKNGKNYLVPIYVADMVKNELPNKAIKPNKPENEWLEMDENYEFRFSLYYNDLVKFKKDNKDFYAYYRGTDRSTGAISLISSDGSQNYRIGVQSLEIFDKYEVDVLGNYYKVKKEKRKGGKKTK